MLSKSFNLPTISQIYQIMRIDRPVPILLTLMPCWWSIVCAESNLQIKWLIITWLGAIVARGAGCIINDIFDIDIDLKVERTKDRLITSGEVSKQQAINVLIMLACILVLILSFFPIKSIICAIIAIPLIIIYPLTKRFFILPQLVLSLVFNMGVFIGWYAAMPYSNIFKPLVLYLGCMAWTFAFDTIYAFQDIKDDKKLKLFSSAITLGKDADSYIRHAYKFFGFILLVTGVYNHMSVIYYIGWIGAVLQINWQLHNLDIDSPDSCRRVFLSNQWLSIIVFVSFLMGRVFS